MSDNEKESTLPNDSRETPSDIQNSQESGTQNDLNRDSNTMDVDEAAAKTVNNDEETRIAEKENSNEEKMNVDEEISIEKDTESQNEDISNKIEQVMEQTKSLEIVDTQMEFSKNVDNTDKDDDSNNYADKEKEKKSDTETTEVTLKQANEKEDVEKQGDEKDDTKKQSDNKDDTDEQSDKKEDTEEQVGDNSENTKQNSNNKDKDANEIAENSGQNANIEEHHETNEDTNMDCTEEINAADDETKNNAKTAVEVANKDKQNENENKIDETSVRNEEISEKNNGENHDNDKETPMSLDPDNSIVTEEDLSRNSNNNNGDDSNINDENSIFVQMNSEKDDSEKSMNAAEQGTNDIDPIGSSDWNPNNENTFVSDLDEADECIIPDTNRDESIPSDTSKEADTTVSSTSVASSSSDSLSMKLSEKYLVSVANTEDQSTCMICNEKMVCKYNCVKDNDKTNICSEDCLAKLKEQHAENVIVRQLRVKNFSIDKNLQSSSEADGVSKAPAVTTTPVTGNISCRNCSSIISDVNNSLSWEALDFCDEHCLTKHQKLIGSFCANCRIEVKENFLGKYCVRFGYNVRQFCSSTCLEQYKKNSKVCSYCQDDISGNTNCFLTSIGDRGMSKDFCSAPCMQKYSKISKHLKGAKLIDECCVCHKHNTIEIEFEFKDKDNFFCSDPCFVAFKYVNDVAPEKCDMCCKYYMSRVNTNDFLIRYDGVLRKFCQKTCQNIYITTNRKIVSCCWCKVKKYNFDMIQKYTTDSSVLIICSLTCLNFFNASVNATKFKKKRCDFCNKICKGQYHITLADDSMKNFCSYPCVQEYQNKYIIAPARYSEQPVAIPSVPPTSRVTRKSSGGLSQQRKQIIPDVPGPLPIITSVRSLAPTSSQSTRSLRSKSSVPTITTITTLQAESTAPPPVRRIILLRPPDLPSQRNVATLVKPITSDVEIQFKPIMIDKAVQTEDLKDSLILVPIPVPIYVPSPMQMFNLIHPIPLPFPLCIPVPTFIPVTKQTADVVLKEMKKSQRTPTDPYEADLLVMAELVASESEKKEPVGDSEGEAESDGENAAEPSFSPEPQDASNTFGDDMLQMALKMATDFEEPAVDLEGALTASTITATAGGNAPNEQVDEVAPIQPSIERTTFRGRRRGRLPRHGGRGRRRGRPPTRQEIVVPVEPEPQPPPEPVEKPDANMCLKYTFGVNAWKQWVTTKNAELEKSSRRAKPFKPDLLQLTSDELNYSLCLFVKEVRKPNGAEYAPDTIYYLCLGIQQYLFENGRIDNIFCDSYYESFTDCLDEVCKKFSTLYNDSQYIVTRVEEEHLWESKQLGAHSPHVLLSTLMFFNTKHFNLTNVEEHMQLSFSHIMKHWKRVPCQPGAPKNSSCRNILLRFYPPQSAVEGNNRKKKVYEQQENEENPLRCPVKLYEFYLLKCPESVKTRNDVFYLLPERSCVPDSPVWYSTMALGKEALEKMLHRVKMVKEINVALLAS